MGVLRRLSQAFSGNGVPNYSEQNDGDDQQLNTYPSSSSNPYPQSAQFPNDRYHHARGPSDQYELNYEQETYPYENEHDARSERSFDDDNYDRQSIAPSYLTSAARSAAALPGDDSDDEDEREGGDKYALMTAHLYQRAQSLGWFKSKKVLGMGVVSIRIKKNLFKCVCRLLCSSPGRGVSGRVRTELTLPSLRRRTFPKADLRKRDGEVVQEALFVWDSAVSTLNPEVAIKITSKVVHAIMARLCVAPRHPSNAPRSPPETDLVACLAAFLPAATPT